MKLPCENKVKRLLGIKKSSVNGLYPPSMTVDLHRFREKVKTTGKKKGHFHAPFSSKP